MREWGIQTRVLFLALVPLSVIVTLLSMHFIQTRLNDLDQALQERGRSIARQMAPACEYGVFSGNREFLANLARSALGDRDVLRVTIVDKDNNTLAYATRTTRPDGTPMAADAPHGAPAYVFQAPIMQSSVALDDFHDGSVAGATRMAETPAGRRLGRVTVELSSESTIARRNQIMIDSLLIMLVGLAITTFIALRMASTVTGPVMALTAVVRRIKAGELAERVELVSGGELGSLERGVNAMAQELQRSRELEMKQAADALYLEKVRAQVTLESIGDGVITTDARGHVVYMNPVAEQFTGWDRQAAEGLSLKDVFKTVDEATSRPRDYPLHLCLKDGNIIRHDSHHLLVRKDGYRFAIQDSAAPIRDRSGAIIGAAVVFHDMTEMQHMARRMAYLASHDPLTGLINRREFEARLQQVLDTARSEDSQHAICYFDLDQFKIVNDTCGHIAGDELLKQLSQRLQNEIRQSDVLARLGGDEFGVILENCTIDKAQQVAEMLRQSVKSFRFAWQDRSFDIGASIGLVSINADSGSISDVLSSADSACYVAKDRGRNCVHVYQADDVALAQRHGEMQWVHRINRGLENDKFKLYSQAITPLNARFGSTRPFYEILVRMNENGTDIIAPTAFIPAAERYHIMPTIDRRIMSSVFATMQRYVGQAQTPGGAGPPLFSINLSGQSLCDDNFLDFVTGLFEYYALDPQMICFEITETAAIANLARARAFITTLKDMGCSFALDDFGSGLSSFGYLKSLPVDYLKIAGNFIQDIVRDPVDLAMVDAINQVGHIMGLITIAESVETEEILVKLRESGVDYGQGFGIDIPRPFGQVLESHYSDIRRGEVSRS
jgi:diguanylate cyclase (GGDEF)-like protein/PAS domain S-box-containing protein